MSQVATSPQTLPAQPALASQVHCFSVDQYLRMIEIGILTTNHKVELLDGWIVDKMPQKPPHRTAVVHLTSLLGKYVPKNCFFQSQAPITLSTSVPEPDFAIVRGSADDFLEQHPQGSDVRLVIEVADSSLLLDRSAKGILYSDAQIAEYWSVNLVSKQIEVHTQPRSEGPYRQQTVYVLDDSLPLRIGSKKIADIQVKDIIR